VKTILVLGVAIALAGTIPNAQSQIEREIGQVEQDWNDASAAGAKPDPAKQQSMLAMEYLQTTIQGQVYDRERYITSRSNIPSPGKTRKEDERIRVRASLGVVTGRLVNEATGGYSGAYSRVWVKTNDGWRLVAMQFSVPNRPGLPSVPQASLSSPSRPTTGAEMDLLADVQARLRTEILYDAKAYDRLTADDFIFVGSTAQISTKADRPVATRTGTTRGSDVPVLEDVRVHLYGDAATVTYAESGTRVLTVWARNGAQWQALFVHQTVIVGQ